MRIGLPAALVNPYYITFWKTFFEELGLEVVGSGSTTKEILNQGIRYSVPELCVPIKIYTGHVIALLERGVDWIYLPRFVTIRQGDVFCPKFMGLPDMLRHTVPGLAEKMLTHQIQAASDDITGCKSYAAIGARFVKDRKLIERAIGRGREKWRQFRRLCLEGLNCGMANETVLNGRAFSGGRHPVTIGVIGYVYNIYDGFISMDIINRLADLGAAAVTFEMLEEAQLESRLQGLRKNLFWAFSNKLIAAAYHFLEDPKIDGLIHVTAFGCGPDSFLGKMLELDAGQYEKPFMTIRVDEHTGENHLQTRVEAFVDMIAKKKRGKESA